MDLTAAEDLLFLDPRIGRDPDAVLEVAEAAVTQMAAQPFALGVLFGRYIEKHDPPHSVPVPRPARFRVQSRANKSLQAGSSGSLLTISISSKPQKTRSRWRESSSKTAKTGSGLLVPRGI